MTKKCNNVAEKLFGPKSGPFCGDYLLVTIEFVEVKASGKAPAALAVAPLHVVAPVAAAAAAHVKAPIINREAHIRAPKVAKVELAEAGVKPIDLTADSDDDGSVIIASTSAGAAREGGSAGIAAFSRLAHSLSHTPSNVSPNVCTVRTGTIEID